MTTNPSRRLPGKAGAVPICYTMRAECQGLGMTEIHFQADAEKPGTASLGVVGHGIHS